MTDILAEICNVKREHVRAQKQRVSVSELQNICAAQSAPRGFTSTLSRRVTNGEIGLIAEIKKASPSRGVIRADFHPATLAQAYQTGGATCLSVLTDAPYFQGADAYLAQARNAVILPVLRKDFMVDMYQIAESRALGADAILIIMAALSDDLAREMEDAAFALGMDALIEVHDEHELARALTHLRSPLIGINNRSLKTLKVDLATSERLRAMIPEGKIVVCESGIATSADAARMRAHEMHCFLVGESLMLQDDVVAATKSLLAPIK